MRRKYKERKGEEGQTVTAKIKADTVSLQREGTDGVPTNHWTKNGWKIDPLIIPPTVRIVSNNSLDESVMSSSILFTCLFCSF